VDEFLLVKFPESRQLTYKVELAGQKNYSPDSQTVTLRFTAITSPALVTFHVLPPSAVTPDVTAGRA
jgi:hypothetical protein